MPGNSPHYHADFQSWHSPRSKGEAPACPNPPPEKRGSAPARVEEVPVVLPPGCDVNQACGRSQNKQTVIASKLVPLPKALLEKQPPYPRSAAGLGHVLIRPAGGRASKGHGFLCLQTARVGNEPSVESVCKQGCRGNAVIITRPGGRNNHAMQECGLIRDLEGGSVVIYTETETCGISWRKLSCVWPQRQKNVLLLDERSALRMPSIQSLDCHKRFLCAGCCSGSPCKTSSLPLTPDLAAIHKGCWHSERASGWCRLCAKEKTGCPRAQPHFLLTDSMMKMPVGVVRLPRGPDGISRGFDPNSPRFQALGPSQLSPSGDPEEEQEQQEARVALRERYLRSLLAMAGQPLRITMHEKVSVAALFGAADIDILNFQVSDLETPLGVQREALLRCSDIISYSFEL